MLYESYLWILICTFFDLMLINDLIIQWLIDYPTMNVCHITEKDKQEKIIINYWDFYFNTYFS